MSSEAKDWMRRTTSMPCRTSPNTTFRKSHHGAGCVVTKNCARVHTRTHARTRLPRGEKGKGEGGRGGRGERSAEDGCGRSGRAPRGKRGGEGGRGVTRVRARGGRQEAEGSEVRRAGRASTRLGGAHLGRVRVGPAVRHGQQESWASGTRRSIPEAPRRIRGG